MTRFVIARRSASRSLRLRPEHGRRSRNTPSTSRRRCSATARCCGRRSPARSRATIWRGDASTPTRPPLTRELLDARARALRNLLRAVPRRATGDGNGSIVAARHAAAAELPRARLRGEPDQHFFDVITNGYGVMYSYASRVPPRDRWAIVAYIRALQLSQHATLHDAPPTEPVQDWLARRRTIAPSFRICIVALAARRAGGWDGLSTAASMLAAYLGRLDRVRVRRRSGSRGLRMTT